MKYYALLLGLFMPITAWSNEDPQHPALACPETAETDPQVYLDRLHEYHASLSYLTQALHEGLSPDLHNLSIASTLDPEKMMFSSDQFDGQLFVYKPSAEIHTQERVETLLGIIRIIAYRSPQKNDWLTPRALNKISSPQGYNIEYIPSCLREHREAIRCLQTNLNAAYNAWVKPQKWVGTFLIRAYADRASQYLSRCTAGKQSLRTLLKLFYSALITSLVWKSYVGHYLETPHDALNALIEGYLMGCHASAGPKALKEAYNKGLHLGHSLPYKIYPFSWFEKWEEEIKEKYRKEVEEDYLDTSLLWK